MPYRNGTGPQGQGPITGRGFGSCVNSRGNGMGIGGKMGFGEERCFRPQVASLSKDQRKERLNSYKKALENELELIKTEQKKLEEEKGI